MTTLTGRQARHLRALGHHLQPAVMIGTQGLTPAVLAAIEANLTAHELIKIRVQAGCSAGRRPLADELAQRCAAGVAQVLGRTILLYRANPDRDPEERIRLPA
ncbi:MAG: ribosome assembly RNA-binding protein YhbY [Thermodesulfobacteriota bacterium]